MSIAGQVQKTFSSDEVARMVGKLAPKTRDAFVEFTAAKLELDEATDRFARAQREVTSTGDAHVKALSRFAAAQKALTALVGETP